MKLDRYYKLIFLLHGFVALNAQQQCHQFLLFWKSDCKACHVAIPQLVKKMETLDTNRIKIVAISFDMDSIAYIQAVQNLKMSCFIHKYDFKAGYHNNAQAKKYHITKTPTLLYIDDKSGAVLAEGNEAFEKFCSYKKK